MTDEQKDKCHEIAEHYGEEHQMLKAVEEMAELTQAIIKTVHGDTLHEWDYPGELADVLIMLEQLLYMYSRCHLRANARNGKVMVLRMDKEYIDKSEAYRLIKHEAEKHELPASKEAYERAARIISMMKPCGVHIDALMHVMTEEEKAEISSMPIFNSKCEHCGAMCFDDDTYCSECGAYFGE